MARRSKLTPELIEQLVQYVSNGNYVDTACKAVGISDASYYSWMARAREIREAWGNDYTIDDFREGMPENNFTEHDINCLEFLDSMERASAQSEAYAVLTIRKAMPENWTAAMTFLERRFPHKWRKRTTIDSGEMTESEEQKRIEKLMLDDPEAVGMMHEALGMAARGELTQGDGEIEDAVVVVVDSTG